MCFFKYPSSNHPHHPDSGRMNLNSFAEFHRPLLTCSHLISAVLTFQNSKLGSPFRLFLTAGCTLVPPFACFFFISTRTTIHPFLSVAVSLCLYVSPMTFFLNSFQ